MKRVQSVKPPQNSSRVWVITGLLAALLLFMSLTQIATFGAFLEAIEAYDVFSPKPLAVSLIFMQLLAIPALLPLKLSPAMRYMSSRTALVLPIFWTLLAIQASLRGLDIQNCGCYGGYFAQKLSPSIFVQDAVFIVWGAYSYIKTRS